MRPPQFNATVPQNVTWNDCLLDLCRSVFCAMSAPGHPPSKPNKCNVLSGVRHRLFLAEDLSQAYAKKATPLATRYSQRMNIGSLPAMTATDVRTRKVPAKSNDFAPGPGAWSPENVT